MQKRNIEFTILAVVFALLAMCCTFIVVGRADDPAEGNIRIKALTGFLIFWPLFWIAGQLAIKTQWRTICLETILLIPLLWIAYSFFADARTVSP